MTDEPNKYADSLPTDEATTGEDGEKKIPKRYDSVVEDPMQIIKMFELAYMDEEQLEVLIGGQVRLHFAPLVDHVPDPTPVLDEDGEQMIDEEGELLFKKKMYVKLSYFKEMERIILEPLVPATGNLALRKIADADCLLRFYNGVKSLEFPVVFQKFIQVEKQPALQFSFPTKMGVIQKRRHYRVKMRPVDQIVIQISSEILPTFTPKLVDISSGGLAVCQNLAADKWPVGSQIQVRIRGDQGEFIKVDGYLRNNRPVTRKMAKTGLCHLRDTIFGIQFDLSDRTKEQRINELVYRLQQAYIARLKELMEPVAEFSSNLIMAPPPKRSVLEEEKSDQPARKSSLVFDDSPREPRREPEPQKKSGSLLQALRGNKSEAAAPPEKPKTGKEAELAKLFEAKHKKGW